KIPAKFLKIALKIENYSDFTKLTKIFQKSNKPIIFTGMGKLGKISRILHTHFGAVGTFVGLDDYQTATGQLTVTEAETYNLSTISQKTKIGGIIGGKQVEKSLGINFYNHYFQQHKIDAIYLPFNVENLTDFLNWQNSQNCFGFSVTMPFKTELTENPINLFLPKSRKYFNTDAVAFEKSIKFLKISKNEKILIYGSGGTAKTALSIFQNQAYSAGRNLTKIKKLAEKFNCKIAVPNQKFDVIINCTPIGMNGEDFLKKTKLQIAKKTIDLPYSNTKTLLIQKCEEEKTKFVNGKTFWKWQAEKQLSEFKKELIKKEENMNPVEIILKKRNRERLSKKELTFFIESYLNNEIPEYQMSAFLMAIFFGNMEVDEVQALTDVYIKSGNQITFPKTMNTVDKHSSGGVGDKITIPLAPIVAACGAKIPMISGRGLGHTGGTLDKLESIPNLRTNYKENEFKKIVEKVGFSIISQSEKLVPADRRIYALRDVTATVESLPLITASIMSKKIAEGAQNLVIDLKVGDGAFIKNMETAQNLGNLLAQTGKNFGQNVTVIYTNMNAPLGNYVGNSLEIMESIEYLQGKRVTDIHEITKKLAVEMLLLTKIAKDQTEAGEMIEKVIDDGSALEKFRQFIEAQNGNPQVCDDTSLLPQAKFQIPIIAKKSGWIKAINSQQIGYALIDIDAGRKTLNSKLNYASGAFLPYKIGDKITENSVLGKVFCDDKILGELVAKKISKCYAFSQTKVEKEKLILGILK
ncbi:MAG: thymidine phosphorylase, partial [Candidatus Cloacimonetes bacterium]|nr:thymidine phosphorylase [Candidatus Cloacimonadota bacterium]